MRKKKGNWSGKKYVYTPAKTSKKSHNTKNTAGGGYLIIGTHGKVLDNADTLYKARMKSNKLIKSKKAPMGKTKILKLMGVVEENEDIRRR